MQIVETPESSETIAVMRSERAVPSRVQTFSLFVDALTTVATIVCNDKPTPGPRSRRFTLLKDDELNRAE